jgi:Zn ribbon nucleic-acid-binding protein
MDEKAMEAAAFVAPGATKQECRAIAEPIVRAYLSALTAPAAMPGERELVDLLVSAHASLATTQNTARAILALFAPILAEKERLEQVSALECDDCGWAMRFPGLGCVHCGFHRAESRALAAEAALAAERERCALVAEYEAQTFCLLPILGEALKWRRRVTEDLKELIPYVAQIAALGAAREAP